MLYTERFHYYHRYNLKGATNVVFYGLPLYGQFYSEIVNSLSAEDASVLALFTKYEHLQLERIVGVKRAQRLVSSEKTTHLFC
jgi:U3 small nucleolar RNA-associated protein 25